MSQKVATIARWFGMERLPRFSVDFETDNYALLFARADDRIRMVIGTATPQGEGGGGTHVAMTLAQAREVRDGLDLLLSLDAGRTDDA